MKEARRVPKLRFIEFNEKWLETLIGKALSIGSGRDYKHLDEGDIPVYGTGGLMTFVDEHLYDGESVCIGRKGTIDKPVYLNEKFWTVDTLFYTYNFNNSLPKFIYNIFQNINWKLYNEASGVPSLSKSTIEKIKINLPSIPEQQKIVSFLSSVDKKIDQLQQKKNLLEQYKKGVMQQLFSQQLRFKDDNGNAYPDWEEKKLGEVVDINPKSEELPDSFVYIDLESVNNGILNKEQRIFKDEAPSRAQRLLKIGDVLFQTVRPYQMNNYFFDKNDKDYVASTGYAQLRTKNNAMYLYQYLHYDDFVNKVLLRCTGTSYPSINSSDLSGIRVKISTIQEQTKIANFLNAIDIKIESVNTQIETTQQFKKGLLQQMFV